MKRIVTVIAAALTLLTLTTVSTADAADPGVVSSGSGVLVRHDDGYIITGTLRDADSQVVGTLHGTLVERTTGFNSCPDFIFLCQFLAPTCNLLGGEIRFNFRGETFNSTLSSDIRGRFDSSLCQNTNTYSLFLFAWSPREVPGDFPHGFALVGIAQQMTPTLFKWFASITKVS
jgi:hypothetical protein